MDPNSMTMAPTNPSTAPTTTLPDWAAAGFFAQKPSWFGTFYAVLATASAAVSGYHGYKRNNSVGWAIVWFGLGGLFPIITPTIAFAQGFSKRK